MAQPMERPAAKPPTGRGRRDPALEVVLWSGCRHVCVPQHTTGQPSEFQSEVQEEIVWVLHKC